MAVELIVESGRAMATEALRDSANALLRTWGDSECEIAVEGHAPVGEARFSCDGEALVVASTDDPTDPNRPPWTVFSAGALRTPGSIFLAALLSALAALDDGGAVLDESNILGKGARPHASEILDDLERSIRSSGGMAAAAHVRFGHLFANLE